MEKLARLQYREQHDHPLLPNNSSGCQVITKLPTSPPQLQRIKTFESWGTVNSATIHQTITLVLRHARSTPTEEARNEVKLKWSKKIDQVPRDIMLLHPSLRRPFEDFEFNLPRLTFGQIPINDDQAPPDITLENFKAVHFSIRTTPLAVDPVISGEQSEAQWKARHEAWLATFVDGPSIDAMSGLALPGKFCLAQARGEGAALYKIEDLGPCQGSRTASVDLKCVRWKHTPQQGVSGFWGTFELEYASEQGGARRQVKKILTRTEVLVWNVSLVDSEVKTGLRFKGRVLSVPDLRALSRRLPVEYPFPQDIPPSHVKEVRREGRAKKNSSKAARDDPSQFQDSSDDEADAGPHMRRRQPSRSQKSEGAARSAATSAKEDDDEDEASEPEGGEEEGEEEGDEEEEEEEGGEDDSEKEDEDEETGDNSFTAAAPLHLPAPTFAFRAQTFVFVDMNGTEEAKLKYPAVLAFIENIVDDKLCVYWFGAPMYRSKTLNKLYPSVAKVGADAKVVFPKYWFRKKNVSKKRGKVAAADKRLYWGTDDQLVEMSWCLRLGVPFDVTSAASAEAVYAAETISMKLSFIHDYLIPYCISNDIVLI